MAEPVQMLAAGGTVGTQQPSFNVAPMAPVAPGTTMQPLLNGLYMPPAAQLPTSRGPTLRKMSAVVAPEDEITASFPSDSDYAKRLPGQGQKTQFVPPTPGPQGRARQRNRRALWVFKCIVALTISGGLIALAGILISRLHDAAMLDKAPVYPDTSKCQVSPGVNRLQPPEDDRPFLGMSIDWAKDDPTQLESRLGSQPAVVGTFIKMTADSYESDMVIWNAQLMQKAARAKTPRASPSMLHIALMPNATLESIKPDLYLQIAKDMRRVNYDFGIPVLLRFAHEMNGNWNPYGQRPIAYKQAWISLTNAIRNQTNMTAMLWAPNMGQGYPYTSNSQTPVKGTAEFNALDTNKNGLLETGDDPYTPFYPGSDYVDWVGLSIYWFGYQQGVNARPIPNHLVDLIHGTSQWSIQGGQPAWDFYSMFPGKPFAIPETGAAFYTAAPPGPGELVMKQDWWRMALTAKPWTTMPRLRMVGWFEEDKVEERGSVSYAVTFNTTIRQSFLGELPEMVTGGRLVYACDGTMAYGATDTTNTN